MRREVLSDILHSIEEISGSKAVFLHAKGGRNHKVKVEIGGTTQEFAIPDNFPAGCAKKNFYSQMRRKINERIEAVKARNTH